MLSSNHPSAFSTNISQVSISSCSLFLKNNTAQAVARTSSFSEWSLTEDGSANLETWSEVTPRTRSRSELHDQLPAKVWRVVKAWSGSMSLVAIFLGAAVIEDAGMAKKAEEAAGAGAGAPSSNNANPTSSPDSSASNSSSSGIAAASAISC